MLPQPAKGQSLAWEFLEQSTHRHLILACSSSWRTSHPGLPCSALATQESHNPVRDIDHEAGHTATHSHRDGLGVSRRRRACRHARIRCHETSPATLRSPTRIRPARSCVVETGTTADALMPVSRQLYEVNPPPGAFPGYPDISTPAPGPARAPKPNKTKAGDATSSPG